MTPLSRGTSSEFETITAAIMLGLVFGANTRVWIFFAFLELVYSVHKVQFAGNGKISQRTCLTSDRRCPHGEQNHGSFLVLLENFYG